MPWPSLATSLKISVHHVSNGTHVSASIIYDQGNIEYILQETFDIIKVTCQGLIEYIVFDRQ